MFFLLNNPEKQPTGPQSIEAQLRSERLKKLYHELFYNVSYFNLIAIASIIVATVLLLPIPEVPRFMQEWPLVDTYVIWLETSSIPAVVSAVFRGVVMFVFYAVTMEVIYTIARLVGRTSFYFQRKMDDVRAAP
jgi:hypothetical protein